MATDFKTQLLSDKKFKLFLMIVWELRESGLDWERAEKEAWDEADSYYARLEKETEELFGTSN